MDVVGGVDCPERMQRFKLETPNVFWIFSDNNIDHYQQIDMQIIHKAELQWGDIQFEQNY